ncbi:cytochrome P450 [Acidocella aquatica]|uniref:Cytochrome P450 n=1 Tax=Acidocella aquatica TaxID=1922313 RepID=A0ABQ6AEY4_9PROT|nr:cytochrome P450 [Acidocella aquatica]GLR68600.1 cytochrome P450 [Acidocella aquatica]
MDDRITLAREWTLSDDPRASICPFRAAARLHDGPDIFFKTGEVHVRDAGLGGNWVVTRHALQEEILLDPARFSSHLAIGFSKLAGDSWPLVPLELDPPEHTLYRKVIAPWFTPAKARELSGEIRALAARLIEGFRRHGAVEFVTAFGQPYPITVFLLMMGLAVEQMPIFLNWEEELLRGETMEIRGAAAIGIKSYLLDLIAQRRRAPGEDIISYLLAYRLDGAPIPDDRLMGLCFMLFAGGLDTVASSLGFIFRELALRPDLQDALRNDLGIIPAATDEFLRAFSVVNTFRYATCDMVFHGVQLNKGDLIQLPLGLASRDGKMHAAPHTIDFSRASKRSLAFSTGPHTCAGMHLARTEIRIALEEWIKHVPSWRISDPTQITTATESVWALHSLPLVWPPAS